MRKANQISIYGGGGVAFEGRGLPYCALGLKYKVQMMWKLF
jgi:hypothetical protein